MSVAPSLKIRRAKAPERRKQPRKGTLWHGELKTPAGAMPCRVLNLSVRGAKLEVDGRISAGEIVALVMEPLGEFSGVVAWAREGKIGLRINEHRITRTKIALWRARASESFAD